MSQGPFQNIKWDSVYTEGLLIDICREMNYTCSD